MRVGGGTGVAVPGRGVADVGADVVGGCVVITGVVVGGAAAVDATVGAIVGSTSACVGASVGNTNGVGVAAPRKEQATPTTSKNTPASMGRNRKNRSIARFNSCSRVVQAVQE